MLYKEDESRRTDVNKRDFFHNVFEELCAPDSESQLLMYNDNQTMSWFPTMVRQIIVSLGHAKDIKTLKIVEIKFS